MGITNTLMAENPLAQLLKNNIDCHVGYVYSINFTHALVLTNDAWKERVGGIPHNCFLIAAAFNPETLANTPEFDKEVILLRVLDPAPLPQDSDLLKTRIEHNQRRTTQEINPLGAHDEFDFITQAELQYGGLNCRILGTFYMDSGKLRLGSDLENYMASNRLQVFKPHNESLGKIVNHINPEIVIKSLEEAKKSGFQNLPSPIQIGTVRYTSTARLHRRNSEDLVPVYVQPSDFLGRRTAVLGMTRTGKSNTVKTTVTAVANVARKDSLKIGQIIFDINGEYANANHQDDGSSIADVFGQSCVRYRAIKMPEGSGFLDLRINFYLEPAAAISLLNRLSMDDPYRLSTDIDSFLVSSLEKPDPPDISEITRWKRYVAVFQCILYKAGYTPPNKNFMVEIPVSRNVFDEIFQKYDSTNIEYNGKSFSLPVDEACHWFLTVRDVNYTVKKGTKGKRGEESIPGNNIGLCSKGSRKPWVDSQLEAYLNVLAQKNDRDMQIRGYRAIANYRDYHSERRQGDVIVEILHCLEEGKIVILDLSVGPVEMRTVLSERIARQIFERSFAKMNRGETPQNVVIYVEEAHNLIGKKDDLSGTWPRIAKEGAKAKIAFVYATQEPSSIHPNILANTENWFVTHLNNDDELRTLSKFYDFIDFRDSLKIAQDIGFARIKTLSSPFVVPTQINKFSPEELKKSVGR